jgi:hypothetical protein
MKEIILLITYLFFEVLEQITHNKLFGIVASFTMILLGLFIITSKEIGKESNKEGFIYLVFGIILSILKIKNYNSKCSDKSEHYKQK